MSSISLLLHCVIKTSITLLPVNIFVAVWCVLYLESQKMKKENFYESFYNEQDDHIISPYYPTVVCVSRKIQTSAINV